MPGENAGVLCVDDDPRMLEVLRLALRKGFDVTTATSGAEGLTILKQKPATAVVTVLKSCDDLRGALPRLRLMSDLPHL